MFELSDKLRFFRMQNLLANNIRCLIMTSGTLAPLDTFIEEFQFKELIEIREEFPHIIRPEQFIAKSLNYGPKMRNGIEVEYDSRLENRKNKVYLDSIGLSIIRFSKCIPGGILVFFPKYEWMQKCIEYWREQNHLEIKNELDFMGDKSVFIEPRKNLDFKECLKHYRAEINDQKGAIFLAVARGKVSEGLNFADAYGRGVIFVGFPLPPCSDPKVFFKRKYLDDDRNRALGLSGSDWYNLEAWKAVNQAIGRIIRHKNDYGAILLCDYRLQTNGYHLSQWVRGRLEKEAFHSVETKLSQFFENAYIKSVSFGKKTKQTKLLRLTKYILLNSQLLVPNTQPDDDIFDEEVDYREDVRNMLKFN